MFGRHKNAEVEDMAKKKDDAEDITPATDSDDRAELLAKIAALKAENAKLKGTPPPQPSTEGMTTFRVSLPHVPARVVLATDQANAIEAYKRDAGVISSIHPFEVSPCEPLTGEDGPTGPCA